MKKLGRKTQRYSKAFRHRVMRSILEEGLSAREASQRYGMSNTTTIYRWLDELDTKTSSKMKAEDSDSKKSSKRGVSQAELEALREELRLERLRSEAYKQMIKEAEAYFNIRIEKKSGSKQSKK